MASKRKRIRVGDLRHRVKITNWVEKPDEETGIIRHREPLAEVWAKIDPMKAIDVHGWRVNVGNLDAPTHKICIRNPSDLLISSDHWFYTETRREKAWYKVLTIQPLGHDERFLEIMVSKRTFADVRRDPAVQDVPAEKPKLQENQMEELQMDAPTDPVNVRPKPVRRDLQRFVRKS